MKFSIGFLALAMTATSALAQMASPDVVDEVFAREEQSYTHSLRELEDVHARNAEDILMVRRDIERLERRSKTACWAACVTAFSGANRIACYRRCDKIWGPSPP